MVRGAAGDAPAVAGLGEVGGVADGQFQAAGDEVAGLLVGVGVKREAGALVEAEFGEEGVGAEDEGFLADFVEGGVVVGVRGFFEHVGLLLVECVTARPDPSPHWMRLLWL